MSDEVKTPNMRDHWFSHVADTRKKLSKAAKTSVSHQEAMKKASTTWAVKKAKIVKKRQRDEKRAERTRAKKARTRSKAEASRL